MHAICMDIGTSRTNATFYHRWVADSIDGGRSEAGTARATELCADPDCPAGHSQLILSAVRTNNVAIIRPTRRTSYGRTRAQELRPSR